MGRGPLLTDLVDLDHFADGVLWAGLGRHADVASIQATWADALGADLTDVPDPAVRRQRRLLIVLDAGWE